MKRDRVRKLTALAHLRINSISQTSTTHRENLVVGLSSTQTVIIARMLESAGQFTGRHLFQSSLHLPGPAQAVAICESKPMHQASRVRHISGERAPGQSQPVWRRIIGEPGAERSPSVLPIGDAQVRGHASARSARPLEIASTEGGIGGTLPKSPERKRIGRPERPRDHALLRPSLLFACRGPASGNGMANDNRTRRRAHTS